MKCDLSKQISFKIESLHGLVSMEEKDGESFQQITPHRNPAPRVAQGDSVSL